MIKTIVLKNILIIITILCFSSVHAQYEWTPAKVILKNGTSFRGLVKFPMHSGGLVSIGNTKFKYKKSRKSNIINYGADALDTVIFGDEQFAIVQYQYVSIKKNKSVLMELVTSGIVNLYTRTVSQYSNTFMGNQNFPTSTTIDYNAQYYLKRKEENVATLIAGPNSFASFNYKAKKYFSDCEKIIGYLENELYDLNNLTELVDDYNLLCE